MNEQTYELVALILRYPFTLMAVIIAIGGLRSALRDGRRARRMRSALPGAGIIGELLVTRGGDEVRRGERYPLVFDMLIGRARKCDLRLTDPSIYPQHARLEYRDGGVLISSIGRSPLCMEGQPLDDEIFVCDGEVFLLGDLKFQLTLYDEGVEFISDYDSDPQSIYVSETAPDDTPPPVMDKRAMPSPKRKHRAVSEAVPALDKYDAYDDYDAPRTTPAQRRTPRSASTAEPADRSANNRTRKLYVEEISPAPSESVRSGKEDSAQVKPRRRQG